MAPSLEGRWTNADSAEALRASYENETNATARLELLGWEPLEPPLRHLDLPEHTHVFVRDVVVLVTLRGSATVTDWLVDDVSILTGTSELISGRLASARDVVNSIRADRRFGDSVHIVAVGHSLGGFLAAHSGADTAITADSAVGPFDRVENNTREFSYRAPGDLVSSLSSSAKTIPGPGSRICSPAEFIHIGRTPNQAAMPSAIESALQGVERVADAVQSGGLYEGLREIGKIAVAEPHDLETIAQYFTP